MQLDITVLPSSSSYDCVIGITMDGTGNISRFREHFQSLLAHVRKTLYPADFFVDLTGCDIFIRHKSDAMLIKLGWVPKED